MMGSPPADSGRSNAGPLRSKIKLEAKEVRLEYPGQRGRATVLALDQMSLSVREGEFISVVGPSGCGKSTFLKIVAGLLNASGGEILLDGNQVQGPGISRAMVFQDSSLFPWFTVSRNISYGLECRGTPAREARSRVMPLVELVGLQGFADHYPYELSGGMQQRVNLARALAVDPEILLMDEPFASLDAQTREIMQSELLDIWRTTRKTVLFVTHNIGEAIYLGDRVVVMSTRPGTVLKEIDIAISRPRSLETKRSRDFVDYEDEVWGLLEQQVRREMFRERDERIAATEDPPTR